MRSADAASVSPASGRARPPASPAPSPSPPTWCVASRVVVALVQVRQLQHASIVGSLQALTQSSAGARATKRSCKTHLNAHPAPSAGGGCSGKFSRVPLLLACVFSGADRAMLVRAGSR
eukprot:2146113-Rhodomonas_salina.2